jgi:enoyl-CoA hydratase
MKLSTDKMLAEVDGHIGWMTFNNPEKRNALSHEMRAAALEILAEFEKDDRVRVVILKGAGDQAFISGADINQFDKGEKGEEQRRQQSNISDELRQRYDHYSKPIIAMIHGYCLGGGLLTAMAVDIRIASEDAQFGIPAGRLGIAYPLYGVNKLVQLVGPAKAKEILFSAGRFGAAEALRIGLVNQVVPRSELESTVRKLAASICENAPLSMRAAKVTIDELMKNESQRNIAACDAVAEACMKSEDFKEGRRAFAEKRKPVFVGR